MTQLVCLTKVSVSTAAIRLTHNVWIQVPTSPNVGRRPWNACFGQCDDSRHVHKCSVLQHKVQGPRVVQTCGFKACRELSDLLMLTSAWTTCQGKNRTRWRWAMRDLYAGTCCHGSAILLGFFSVYFDVTHQLLTIPSEFVIYFRKNGNKMWQANRYVSGH